MNTRPLRRFNNDDLVSLVDECVRDSRHQRVGDGGHKYCRLGRYGVACIHFGANRIVIGENNIKYPCCYKRE